MAGPPMLAVKIVRDVHALNGVAQGNHFSHGHCLQNHGYSKSREMHSGTKGINQRGPQSF